jgi:hypothetical protein
MKLNQRLKILEREIINEPIVLTMPDGRTKTLPGSQATGLLARSIGNERTPEIEIVARSISSPEPGGGHLIDLARAILNSPAGDGRVKTFANASRSRNSTARLDSVSRQ